MSATAAPAPWNHEQEAQTTSVDHLIRRAVLTANTHGLDLSPSKASRLVRRFMRNGNTLASAATMLTYYCMPHPDPTGESAARNVDTFDAARLSTATLRRGHVSRGEVMALVRGDR